MPESFVSAESVSAPSPASQALAHRDSIVMVRWALTVTCGYLVLFSESGRASTGLTPLVIVAFLASNLIIGRLPARAIAWPSFHVSLASLDTLLIGVSLYCAGQLSVELVVLLLGVLVLAIGGIRLGMIAVLTVALAVASLLMVAINGSEPLHHSSMLLRVPFLLAAAIAYAWLAEVGRHEPGGEARASDVVSDLAHDLSGQFEAIERCQAAAAQGLVSVTQGLLAEIAQANLQMRAKAAGVRVAPMEGQGTPAVAHAA